MKIINIPIYNFIILSNNILYLIEIIVKEKNFHKSVLKEIGKNKTALFYPEGF